MPELTWIGKDKVVNHHHDVPFRILERQYTFGTANSGNKIIHGDNLEALKSLLPEYEGRIRCIYIDPPYNTGNEGWVYNDNVNDPKLKKWLNQVVGKEGEDLSRHDKWLCMMYPRLKLLRRLLSDDGVIFVSIDDHEGFLLKQIMDEIFGQMNFLCSFAWEKRYGAPPDTKDIGYTHETILSYRRSPSFVRNLLMKTDAQIGRYKNPDSDERGPWKSMDYTCRYTRGERPNLYYGITQPNNGATIFPKETRVWAFSLDEHLRNERENRIWWGKRGTNSVPSKKNFLTDTADGAVPVTLLEYEVVGHTDEAAKELRAILPDLKFTPKPTRLIEHFLKIGSDKNSIVLDSFVGSGTTAHSVLKLNAADGGNRKFILIEQEDYAETITAERIRRVMNGYGEGTKAVAGLGGSFDYYTIGEPLFFEDGNLNEEIGVEEIRKYVAYTENLAAENQLSLDNKHSPYVLGIQDETAYFFYYEKDRATTLDLEFLSKLKFRPKEMVFYADICLLNKKQLQKYGIIFKKIPRDITRF